MDREPCPYRIVEDAGGAFVFGLVGKIIIVIPYLRHSLSSSPHHHHHHHHHPPSNHYHYHYHHLHHKVELYGILLVVLEMLQVVQDFQQL